MILRYHATRYFADNVRDDYAAGQLDAQVNLSYPLTPQKRGSHDVSFLGRRCLAGDEGAVHLRSELNGFRVFCRMC